MKSKTILERERKDHTGQLTPTETHDLLYKLYKTASNRVYQYKNCVLI